jgi:hypothetical protein
MIYDFLDKIYNNHYYSNRQKSFNFYNPHIIIKCFISHSIEEYLNKKKLYNYNILDNNCKIY